MVFFSLSNSPKRAAAHDHFDERVHWILRLPDFGIRHQKVYQVAAEWKDGAQPFQEEACGISSNGLAEIPSGILPPQIGIPPITNNAGLTRISEMVA